MKPIKHRFFEVLKECMKKEGYLARPGFPKARFMRALREAHPFIYDKKSSEEAAASSTNYVVFEPGHFHTEPGRRIKVRDVAAEVNMIEEFSLPFSTSLYILTKAPTVVVDTPGGDPYVMKIHGYLIEEETPEKFIIYMLSERKLTAKESRDIGLPEDFTFPILDWFPVDLSKEILKNFEEVMLVNRLTNMVSVKRIGIETRGSCTIKTKGISTGFTVLKYDNLVHIADKEEYEYTTPVLDGEINFEWVGHWRGHWRALYHTSDLTDAYGRRIVDYTRMGKNRAGAYNVPGYTWVIDHVRGDKKLAEIRTHAVKAK